VSGPTARMVRGPVTDAAIYGMTADGVVWGRHPLRQARWWLRALVAAVVVVVIFGFALPRMVDYDAAWNAITAMTRWEIAVIAVVGAWNLYTYWPLFTTSLPGLRLREAIVVNQASTAVANSVPAGAAVSVGVTYRMLRAWGFTSQSITNQMVAMGVCNMLVKLTMPVVSVAIVAVTGDLRGGFLRLAVIGLSVTGALVTVATLVLRAEGTTERAGRVLDRWWTRVRRGRPSTGIEPWLLEARAGFVVLARRVWSRMMILTLISHLSLFTMLLVTLRNVGVSEADISWTSVFAVFAFVRLLSAIPLTPGGVGVVELGYVGFLTSEAPSHLAGEIAAGVLVFRAVTFVLPVLLGSVAWMVFQSASSWRRPPNTRGRHDHD
jgi:putative heme transporter